MATQQHSAHKHILVVDDELTTRTTLTAYFEAEGFRVSAVENGERMRAALAHGDVDLVLLDIRLAGEDGLTLLREVRRTSDIGVILVTGKSDEIDRVVGLETGADDYVTKPFSARELLARAKGLLRRTSAAHAAPADGAAVKHFAGWSLDVGKRRLSSPAGEDVRLTRAEFELLLAFVRNPGRVLTRDNLLDHVSRRDWAPNDRTVDVLVGRLRRKVEADPNAPRMILTEHGIGYVFVEAVA
ncbi:response regulator [Azospirillum sp. TSO22-1]|uniref:response regulator n=1 Tax=Azospirillum sp. TSO22-1 TaxID=716789 RepID=UPI000D60C604|nr:response regulator [Azospirillum sp. TSO22-1]PWC35230.1 transcriptional regulator [Azospirillum sp. TSO22-1]